MFKSLKFPLIYIVELALWLLLLAGFFVTTSFVGSEPIGKLNLQGKTLPSSWEAAVRTHGNFLEGYLISNHPFIFALSLLCLTGSTALLYQAHKAQLWQRQQDGVHRATAHKFLQALVTAILVAGGYHVFTRYLVGVAPV